MKEKGKEQPPPTCGRGYGVFTYIIHIVVDRIKPGRRTRVGHRDIRASKCGHSLGRGIVDEVTRTGTAALEGVAEVEPVPDLVCQGFPQPIRRSSAGEAFVRNNTAVHCEIVC